MKPKKIDALSKQYEKFKLEWIISHGYTIQDIFNILDEIYEGYILHDDIAPKPSALFEDFECDYGFEQNLYPSFSEWLDNENNKEKEI